MQELLDNPAVQSGVAPFLLAMMVAASLTPFRLAGLAVPAAFVLCVYLVSGIQFTPLTATRKILIVALAAAAMGPLIDRAFRTTRLIAVSLGVAAAMAGLWVFWPVLSQKPAGELWLLAGVVACSLGLATGFSLSQLAGDGLRAGAATLALGLGAGIAALLGASLSYALYGVALAAGAGGYLLLQMMRGKAQAAGATLVLPAMVIGVLIACGAMLLAQLPWYCVMVLALVPIATRLRAPATAAWLQAVVLSLYGFVVATVACLLAWRATSST